MPEYAAHGNAITIRNLKMWARQENYNPDIPFMAGAGISLMKVRYGDLLAPDVLAECCVGVMDAQPDVVLCYTLARAIDAHGDVIKDYPGKQRPNDEVARFRFYEFVLDPHPVVAVFGLMRSEVLGRTRLIGKYSGSDRPLQKRDDLLVNSAG